MIDIVFLFLVFCVGFVSVGVLGWSKEQIVKTIENKVKEVKDSGDSTMQGLKVVYDKYVDTAAIDTNTKTIYTNLEDIHNAVTDTTQNLYNAIKNDSELIKELGLDTIDKTYQALKDSIGDSVISSTIYHEAGHIISGASEVGAELYRSMRNGYDELKKEDKLEYAVSFYNLVKNGADKGLETAQETYKLLKEQYGATVEPIKDLVNAMLNASEKISYKSKRFVD
ncbi:MAG: hypothetical protein GQ477_04450 [Nanohaloarchaea archaeon]|nr:hypothetical protein [Candidatus Nanohaloarchaea archaeon]